jgi:hypothetical protein
MPGPSHACRLLRMVLDPWEISQRLLAGEAEREALLADLPEMLGIDMSKSEEQKRMDEMAAEVKRRDDENRARRAREAKEEEERERRARGN